MAFRLFKNMVSRDAASNSFAGYRSLSFYPTPTPENDYDIVLLGKDIETVLLAYVLIRHFGQKRVAVLAPQDFYEPDGDELLTPYSLPLECAELFNLSHTLLRRFSKHFPVECKPLRQSCLRLIKSNAHMRQAVDQANTFAALGIPGWIITPRETHIHAPLLALHPDMQGALLLPETYSINRQALYYACLNAAQDLGVTFIADCPVNGLHCVDGKVESLQTAKGSVTTRIVVNSTLMPAVAESAPSMVSHSCREWQALPIRAPFKPAVMSYEDDLHILYNNHGTFTFRDFQPGSTLETTAQKILKLLPDIAQHNVHIQHVRDAVSTDNGVPVIGSASIKGLFTLNGLGWNRYCFAFGAAVALASTLVTRALHPALRPLQREERAA